MCFGQLQATRTGLVAERAGRSQRVCCSLDTGLPNRAVQSVFSLDSSTARRSQSLGASQYIYRHERREIAAGDTLFASHSVLGSDHTRPFSSFQQGLPQYPRTTEPHCISTSAISTRPRLKAALPGELKAAGTVRRWPGWSAFGSLLFRSRNIQRTPQQPSRDRGSCVRLADRMSDQGKVRSRAGTR